MPIIRKLNSTLLVIADEYLIASIPNSVCNISEIRIIKELITMTLDYPS